MMRMPVTEYRHISPTESRGIRSAITKNFVDTTTHGLGYQIRVEEAGEEGGSIDEQMLGIIEQGQDLYREYVPPRP